MSYRIDNFIDGETTESRSERFGAIFNPATGQQQGSVVLSTADECAEAIACAERAFGEWSQTPPLVRARVLFRFKELMEQHRDELAQLISREHGKVFSDAQGELTRGWRWWSLPAAFPTCSRGALLNVGRGVDSHSMMQPVGVCAGITPFNFPAMVPLWMFPVAWPAATPSSSSPRRRIRPSLRMAELLKQAGLPDGVLNVVNGDKEVVDAADRPEVGAVSFVGSTPIAQYIYATASAHGKRVQALGGAKNHMVVMPDANLDQAVSALMGPPMARRASVAWRSRWPWWWVTRPPMPWWRSSRPWWRPCGSARAWVRVRRTRWGPHQPGTPGQGARLRGSGGGRGGRAGGGWPGPEPWRGLLHRGQPVRSGRPRDAHLPGGDLRPRARHRAGPDYETALRLINEHEYGNGTAIFTGDGDTARDFTTRVQVGMVGVNVPIPVPMAFHSFGGWKRSIFGPLNMHGPDGVRFYTRMKTVTARWPQSLRAGAEFSMPTMK
jgi:malonate-semialdehyde dehydrogenase (acetylating)/methylmalonate-semialdehyde dehydrogenase